MVHWLGATIFMLILLVLSFRQYRSDIEEQISNRHHPGIEQQMSELEED